MYIYDIYMTYVWHIYIYDEWVSNPNEFPIPMSFIPTWGVKIRNIQALSHPFTMSMINKWWVWWVMAWDHLHIINPCWSDQRNPAPPNGCCWNPINNGTFTIVFKRWFGFRKHPQQKSFGLDPFHHEFSQHKTGTSFLWITYYNYL